MTTAADPTPSPTSSTVTPDAPAPLQRWAAGFRAVLDSPVELLPFVSEGVSGQQVRVAATAFEQPTLVGGIGHFKHMPAMVEHVRRLGFDWGGDGRLWTFPAPDTFNALLPSLAERFAGPGAGFRVEWVEHDSDVLPMGRWLRSTIGGRYSAHLCGEARYAGASTSALRSQVRFSLQSVVHDVTVHGLNSHLVPREAIDALGRRIEEALPERFASWGAEGALPPTHLAYFYDNDFNRYCYAVWCRTAHPGDFAARFLKPGHFAQLLEILDRRIDEVRRGLSDVASGDTKDVSLSPGIEYRVD